MSKVPCFPDEDSLIDQLATCMSMVNENLKEEGEGVEVHYQVSEVHPSMIVTTGDKRYLVLVYDLTGIGGQDAV